MKDAKSFWLRITGFALALAIPALLLLESLQSKRFMEVETDVSRLEQTQVELVEENRKLITDISILSASGRIEAIATEDLGMRKAASDEIVRIEMKQGNN
jgi:cell division protein FtsL